MGETWNSQRIHQRCELTDLTCILERVVSVGEGSLGITKHPEGPRSMGEDYHSVVFAKSRRQLAMLGRIVKRDRLIVVRPTLGDVSRTQQGKSHDTMPDHERDCGSLRFGERQELSRKLAQRVAVKCHVARDPEAKEDREQQQRVFGGLSECFSLFDQQTCPLHNGLRFRRTKPFDMHEWVYERDLKLYLFPTQCWSGR